MSVVLKVSKPTFDALSTGNANLAFNAELATYSIYNALSITKPTGVTSVTHNHNLGFVPKVWVFQILTDGDGEYYRRIPIAAFDPVDYYVTENTLVIDCGSFSSGLSYSLKAIIFTRSPNP